MEQVPWWQKGVIYQAYPRSFQDANGDGVGDLRGIIDRLDHLSDGTEDSLGVDGLWLSPIHPSPDRDFGYDISDYCDVDRKHGDLATFDVLVRECHARGIRVVLDLVVNHTSDRHPWFAASRSSRDDPRRDWYLWRDPRPGGRPPNNWASTFGGQGWTFDAATGQSYCHSFLPQQPDLNWRNPAVEAAVHDVLRFWMDRGVDGFRLDVYNCYFKDARFRDNPRTWNPAGLVYGYIGQRHVHDRDQPEMMEALRRMRQVVDAYPDRFMVGETLDELGDYDKAARYYGENRDGLHTTFNFRLLRSRWGARSFGAAIRAWLAALPDWGWPTWVLSNHDFPRQASRHDRGGHGDARAKLMAVLLTTLRGVPVLYYGEEIGMRERRMARDEILDPPGKRFWPFFRGRDGCRTPMQWDASPGAGFTSGTPWLPLHPDWRERNVAAQDEDPDSILSVYRRLVWLRRRQPVLQVGELELPPEDDARVLTWRRTAGAAWARVVLNMSADRPRWEVERGGEVWFSTHGRATAAGALELAPHEGLVVGATSAR